MDTEGNPITKEQLVQRIKERSLLPSDRESQTLCSGVCVFVSGLTSYLSFTSIWKNFAKRPVGVRLLSSGLGGAAGGLLALSLTNGLCMSKYMSDVLSGKTLISNREKAIDSLMAQGKWSPQQFGGAYAGGGYASMGMPYQQPHPMGTPYSTYPPYYPSNINQMHPLPQGPNSQQFQSQPQPQAQPPAQQFQSQPPAQQFQSQPQPPAQQFQSQQPTQQFQTQPLSSPQQFQTQSPQLQPQLPPPQLPGTQVQPQPPFLQKPYYQQNQPLISQNQTSPSPQQSQPIPQPTQSPFGESNQQLQPNPGLLPPYKPPTLLPPQTYQPYQQPGYPGYPPAPAYGNRFAPYLPPPVSNAPVSHLERTLPIPPYAQSIQGMPPGGPARGGFPGGPAGVPPGAGGFPGGMAGGPGGMAGGPGAPFGYPPNAMMGQPLPQRPLPPFQQQPLGNQPPQFQFPPQTNATTQPPQTDQPQPEQPQLPSTPPTTSEPPAEAPTLTSTPQQETETPSE